MRTKLTLLFITILFVLAACSIDENNNKAPVQENNEISENDDADNHSKKIIELNFTPVPKEILKDGLPKEEWIKGKSIYFGNLTNQIESTMHLYIDNTINSDLRPGEGRIIYGFLEHGDKIYELGDVSSYGIDDVNVKLADRTFDGIKEIEIEGAMGATYVQLKIISFNEANNEWENILTMGSPSFIDLDRDGQEELIASSRGSLPPWVDIYRWNNDHFETVDIAEATDSDYVTLNTIDGIIETGLIENGKAYGKTTLYKYEDSKLIGQ
ncbi:MAG: hypothetical protein AB7V48_02735 [Sedimentibacter sp.]